jgi:hypothetical protein
MQKKSKKLLCSCHNVKIYRQFVENEKIGSESSDTAKSEKRLY